MATTVRERNKKVIRSLTLQGTTTEQGAHMDAIRKAAQSFAKVVVKHTESGPESTLAQRHIEQAVFYGIRSVLFDEAPADVPPVGAVHPAPVKKAAVKRTVKRKSA